MYSERLLDHFRRPRHVGELAPPAVTVEVVNPACGDIMRLSARWESGRVAEVGYRTRGCTAAIAAGSALTEWMLGKSPDELAALTPAALEEALGDLPPASRHALTLCLDCVKALLQSDQAPRLQARGD